jgi:hypothetical protein
MHPFPPRSLCLCGEHFQSLENRARIKKQRARIDYREVDGFLAESHPW